MFVLVSGTFMKLIVVDLAVLPATGVTEIYKMHPLSILINQASDQHGYRLHVSPYRPRTRPTNVVSHVEVASQRRE